MIPNLERLFRMEKLNIVNIKVNLSGVLCQVLMALESQIQESDCNCSGKISLRVIGGGGSKQKFAMALLIEGRLTILVVIVVMR